MHLLLENERKPRKRRWWKTQTYKRRGGSELMMNLKCQKMSGQYKNFDGLLMFWPFPFYRMQVNVSFYVGFEVLFLHSAASIFMESAISRQASFFSGFL
jgi:hypothetical protein